MPWKAELNGEVVNILDELIHGRSVAGWEKDGYKCVGCGEPLTLVARESVVVRPHFRHSQNSDCPSGGKSKEHELLQWYLYAHLKKKTENWGGFDVDVEHYLPASIDERRTFADVMVMREGVPVEAHEIQLSRQSIDEYERRTSRYEEMGIATVWWVRRRLLVNPEFLDWALATHAEVGAVPRAEPHRASLDNVLFSGASNGMRESVALGGEALPV